MSIIEERLQARSPHLPPPIRLPPGVVFPFALVRVIGRQALISGHGPQNHDGSLAEPPGKVGQGVSLEQGYHSARPTALSIAAGFLMHPAITFPLVIPITVGPLSSHR